MFGPVERESDTVSAPLLIFEIYSLGAKITLQLYVGPVTLE
jgi:hypothetical protein